MKSSEGKALVIKRKELELERAKIRIRMDLTSVVKQHKIKQINSKLYWVGEEQTELRQKMSKKGLKSHDGINWYQGTSVYKIPNIIKKSYIFRKKTCLWCGKDLPKYRSKYCSDNHRDEYYDYYRGIHK